MVYMYLYTSVLCDKVFKYEPTSKFSSRLWLFHFEELAIVCGYNLEELRMLASFKISPVCEYQFLQDCNKSMVTLFE